jgi:pilus assembly protein Flp/PilA
LKFEFCPCARQAGGLCEPQRWAELNFIWWCEIANTFWRPHYLEEAMKNLALKVQRFLVSEDGPTAVEYAVMLALIIIVCLTAIQAIGTNANATFQSVADKLPTGGVS